MTENIPLTTLTSFLVERSSTNILQLALHTETFMLSRSGTTVLISVNGPQDPSQGEVEWTSMATVKFSDSHERVDQTIFKKGEQESCEQFLCFFGVRYHVPLEKLPNFSC